jgi:ADP-sugar diphosphatase
MPTFTLPESQPFPGTKITAPDELSHDQLLSFPPFKTWLSTLSQSLAQQSHSSHPFHTSPYRLRSIEIQSIDFFGGKRLGFLKLKAEVSNDEGEKLPGIVFMRGGSVAMLIILSPSDGDEKGGKEEYVILTVQPRIAAGSLAFTEIPAGMIDDSGSFAGAAAKEIEEETGLSIEEKELVDLTALTVDSSGDEKGMGTESHLQKGVYPSPGGSDEFIPIMLARKKMKRSEIENLKGKLTGLRDHGEKITLRVVKLADVWKVGVRDGKTVAAFSVFEGLRREGKL